MNETGGYSMKTWETLQSRGLVEIVSDPKLAEILDAEPVPFYCGFDPTAKSLQLGNLFAIVTMRRLQMLGHRPVALVGGATGMIGDPSGRSTERNLQSADAVEENLKGIRRQLERLIDFEDPAAGAVMVNNHDWLGAFGFLEFLRDVGRRFRVGEMLAKESVRRRMDAEEGVSYTEFTYQILQAYDFHHLHKNHGVRLQIGGGDQWGNITAGIDFIRKMDGAEAYGFVIPLVTDSRGQKFGKSAGNAIYLDPDMTSPYQMYQYLLNADDASVIQYLRYYSFLPLEDIEALARETAERPERRLAQKALAADVVSYVHGNDGLMAAERATRVLFGEAVEGLTDRELAAVFADAPMVELPRATLAAGLNVVDLLASTPLWKGKNDARRSVDQRGAYLNNLPVEDAARTLSEADLGGMSAFVVRKGKKNYALVKIKE